MYQKSLNKLVKKLGKTGQPVSVLASGDENEMDENHEDHARDILAQHPGIDASTFFNLLKSKGMKIVRAVESYREAQEGGDGSGRYPKGSGKNPMTVADARKKGREEKKALGLDSTRDSAWHDVAKSIKKVDKLKSELAAHKRTLNTLDSKKGSSKVAGLEKKLAAIKSKKAAAEAEIAKRKDNIAKLKAKLKKSKNMEGEFKKLAYADSLKNKLDECGARMKDCAYPNKEADSSSANAQFLRDEVKESVSLHVDTRFIERGEGQRKAGLAGYTRFRVVLIQEGLGNIKDSFFYTDTALKSALPIFEGKKIYADHPSAADEAHRPERSVKDVLGHFENIEYVVKEGRGSLEADVVILPDEPYRWARALMRHSVNYAEKYPDKEFVGLSINASGEAEPISIDELVDQVPLSQEMKVKVEKARESGVSVVRIVKNITNAVSCDLVTEAGAGGKVLEMLEKDSKIKGEKNVVQGK